MNVFKRIASFSITLLFSISLCAMDNHPKNFLTDDQRLEDLRPVILHFVHVSKIGGVAELWKELDDGRFWAPYVKLRLGNLANEFKQDGETWLETILRFSDITWGFPTDVKNTLEHIRSMENWTPEQIHAALAEENFKKLVSDSYRILNITFVNNFRPLLKSTKDLLAVPILYCTITHAAACLGPLMDYYHSGLAAINNAAINPAWNDAIKTTIASAWPQKGINSYSISNVILPKAGIPFISEEHSADTKQLCALSTCIYVTQEGWSEKYFPIFFRVAMEKLNTSINQMANTADILATLGEAIWDKPELADNIYINNLKRLTFILAAFVEN